MGYTTSMIHGIGAGLVQANNVPRTSVKSSPRSGGVAGQAADRRRSPRPSPQSPPGLVIYNTTTNRLQISEISRPTLPTSTPPPCLRWGSPTALPKRALTMSSAIAMGDSKVTVWLRPPPTQRRCSLRTTDPGWIRRRSSLAFGLATDARICDHRSPGESDGLLGRIVMEAMPPAA